MTDDFTIREQANKSAEKHNVTFHTEEYVNGYYLGYKAGFHECEKEHEWHYVKDELPKVSGRYWVYTGGEPFTLDFDTEVNAFGYWCAVLSGSLGVCDTVFETVEERKEDEVIAWKEIVLPKELEKC